MRHNVFMGSMYFLYPLQKVKKEYKFKGLEWTSITPPPYVQNAEGEYQFFPWNFSENLEYYFASHAMVKNDRLIRKISLRCYLVRYTSGVGIKLSKYFFAVGASIDKLFPDCNSGTNTDMQKFLCTKNDLVYLKRAFYENGIRGLFPTDRQNQKDFHTWLGDTISTISGVKQQAIQLKYCAADFIGLDIDDTCWTNKEELDRAFSYAYYCSCAPYLDKVLSGDNCSFAYGLLMGDDNYAKVPNSEVRSVLNQGYSNNNTEITYAANNTVFLLHTHHSYIFRRSDIRRQKKLNPRPNGVQNIPELCDVISFREKMQDFHNQLTHSNVYRINDTLVSISRLFDTDFYHLYGLDRKMEYIYMSLGLNKEYEQLMKVGDLASKAEEIKVAQRTNHVIILFAAITALLALIQIIITFAMN